MRLKGKSNRDGFTLIELVVVIVILGILSAIAVPKFVSLRGDARAAVIYAVESSMYASANLVYAKALAQEKEYDNPGTLVINGSNVTIVFGFPDEDQITSLIDFNPVADFTITAATGVVQHSGAAVGGNCQVDYDPPAAAGGLPTITPSSPMQCD